MTALHMAARHGHLEVIQFLLDAGAKLDSRDQMGANILHTAAEHGQVPGGESDVLNVSNACASLPRLGSPYVEVAATRNWMTETCPGMTLSG